MKPETLKVRCCRCYAFWVQMRSDVIPNSLYRVSFVLRACFVFAPCIRFVLLWVPCASLHPTYMYIFWLLLFVLILFYFSFLFVRFPFILSLELPCRRFSGLLLCSRPHTGLATAYTTGYDCTPLHQVILVAYDSINFADNSIN